MIATSSADAAIVVYRCNGKESQPSKKQRPGPVRAGTLHIGGHAVVAAILFFEFLDDYGCVVAAESE